MRGSLSADPAEVRTYPLTLRDSANYRLTRGGHRLASFPAGGDRETWSLATLSGTALASAEVPSPAPAFDNELPMGPLRRHLEALSRGRALHPVAELQVRETVTALRDAEGKIRCRIVVTLATAPDGDRAVDVETRALKGYEADARRVRATFEHDLAWPATDVSAIARIQPAIVSVPGRIGADLRPDDPAGPAMREILSAQLDVLEDRLSGVLADRHPDYLHQFRVAIRRSRSALSQLSQAIALEGRADAIDGFRWLGRVTSPLRDLDVQLLDLAGRRARSDDDPAALDTLERHLLALKTAAHRDLALELSGTRFQSLVARWRDSLSPSSANWTATASLRAPFTEVVSSRGQNLLRKALRDGRRIGPDSEAEMLHDLRKRMKKLRYVTEFLGEVLPRETTKPAIRALKGLQDVLGRVQDREVQVEALHGYGRALASGKGDTAEALMAIGAWSEELERDRRAARAEFAEAFETFAAKETQALFHGIFNGRGDPRHGSTTTTGKTPARGPKED
ncbi:MAG: CHAD domain-containing protein [Thalassobaculaceae bacterium]|nr:CHAD domain-containing protein [Thalassobaculaceae bacterium]